MDYTFIWCSALFGGIFLAHGFMLIIGMQSLFEKVGLFVWLLEIFVAFSVIIGGGLVQMVIWNKEVNEGNVECRVRKIFQNIVEKTKRKSGRVEIEPEVEMNINIVVEEN